MLNLLARGRLALPCAVMIVLGWPCLAHAVNLSGTARADRLVGTNANDTIRGWAGKDKINGLRGRDRLYGGRGYDTIKAYGRTRVNAGSGSDKVIFDAERSTIRVDCGPGSDDRLTVVSPRASKTKLRRGIRRCEKVSWPETQPLARKPKPGRLKPAPEPAPEPAPTSPPTTPANLFVSTTGSDSGSCASAAPCRTLGRAYAVAAAGEVVQVAAGVYPPQVIAGGTKAVTFRGDGAAKLRELLNHADNVTFDGLEIDANFQKVAGFENRGGANVTFKNGRIGNVTDEKGALVSGTNFTFDNVVFHDVRVTDPSVHNECVYAIVVPGMTVRNSSFYACATMDLFFTYGDWWTPLPPAYGGVTLENNVFAHSTNIAPGSWHYYSLYIGNLAHGGGTLTNWTVRNNTFEIPANITRTTSTGSRWVGNLGGWNCVPGTTYRRNVGKRCATTDTQVTPDSSSATTTAPFGWVDPASNDFRLLPGSPAIGAADPNDAPATDRTGRPRDASPDAGAYEYR